MGPTAHADKITPSGITLSTLCAAAILTLAGQEFLGRRTGRCIHGNGLTGGDLAADIQHQAVARPDARAELDQAAVIAGDGGIANSSLPLLSTRATCGPVARNIRAAAGTSTKPLGASRNATVTYSPGTSALSAFGRSTSTRMVRACALIASAERVIFPKKIPAYGARRADLGRHPRLHQFPGRALRHIHEHSQRIVLRHPVERRRRRIAARRHQITEIDLALGDDAVEGRRDLLELGERGVLIDLRFIHRDLRLGGVQASLAEFVIRFLGFAFLLGHDAFGRIAPALIGRLGELGLGLAREDLRLRCLQLRSRAASSASNSGVSIVASNWPFFT